MSVSPPESTNRPHQLPASAEDVDLVAIHLHHHILAVLAAAHIVHTAGGVDIFFHHHFILFKTLFIVNFTSNVAF